MSNIKSWLDSQIPYTETKYSEDGSCLQFEQDRNIIDFKDYYNKNDQDIKASDKNYLSVLKHYNGEKSELCANKNKFLFFGQKASLLLEPYDNDTLQYMKKRVERYNTNKPEHSKEILIPPNTYRYHANYLFKRIIDYVEHNGCMYEYDDSRKKKVIKFKLVDKVMKDAFYKFCYNNTNRDIDI